MNPPFNDGKYAATVSKIMNAAPADGVFHSFFIGRLDFLWRFLVCCVNGRNRQVGQRFRSH